MDLGKDRDYFAMIPAIAVVVIFILLLFSRINLALTTDFTKKDLYELSGLLFAGATLVYAAYHLRALIRNNKRIDLWNRQHAAQLASEKGPPAWNNLKAAIELNHNQNNIAYRNEDIDEAIKDRQNFEELRSLLNFYESLAAGVNSELYDYQVVKRHLDGTILRTFHRFQEYIYKLRREQVEGDRIFHQLEALRDRILEDRRQTNKNQE